ncbi:hypothetical protein [Novosphingobium humi]|uniref:hypothetical protein n=1 Tax=Novosphingobium humi TaxID=2282397 RepID=UPI0025B1CB34|nr:hypothetical protein [Novosphingobium humi]WJS99548.1 hypothetical protein NYQ05_05220 [Novosphingobium humi]
MTQRTHTSTKALTMTIGEWRLRLAELCRDCVLTDSDDEGDCLRLAHALMMQAPDSPGAAGGFDLAVVLSHLPPMARIECLIEQGALDSVALALLPEEASYLMSRSIEGAWLASVFLPGMEEEVTSEGGSLAMALTSALLAALAHVTQTHGAAARDRDVWSQGGDAYADNLWQRPAGTLLN